MSSDGVKARRLCLSAPYLLQFTWNTFGNHPHLLFAKELEIVLLSLSLSFHTERCRAADGFPNCFIR